MVEQGHIVWWIFDSIRGKIESPDLQVEGWVKPQEVPPFGMLMVKFQNLATVNYRHSDINSWLIRRWTHQQLVDNKNSLLIAYQ